MKPLTINVVSESAFTVQGHGVHTAFTETVSALRKHNNIKVLVNSRQPTDVVHLHTIGFYSLAKLVFSKSAIIVSAHVMPDSFVGSLIGAKYWRKYAQAYLKWFYNKADAVIAVSQEVADQLKLLGVIKPVYVIPNTIDTEVYRKTIKRRSRARNELGFNENEFVIIGVGQIQPRKRVDTFVAAARKLPQYRFVWVGGIPFKKAAADYEAMQQMVKKAPQNLLFAGEAKHKEIADYYIAADLFFLPSEQETFGIVIVEAAASGLPLLLRNLTQYQVTFKNNYAVGEDKNFVEKIKLIHEDKKLYQELVDKAGLIAKMYDSKGTAERLVQVYREVAAAKSS